MTTFTHVHINYDLRNWPKPSALCKRIVDGGLHAWDEVAVDYYCNLYTFNDLTDRQTRWLRTVRKLLKETCPDERKVGIHLLAKEAAFMGEDIYSVDGIIQHPAHRKHKECGTYTVLERFGRVQWCVTCDKQINFEDLSND